jgi:7-keto-8-aminopelargonate synthetase-like enzyme
MDFQTTHFRTPIVPIIMDAPEKAQGLSRFLEENGVIAPFMNYPVRKAMHQIRIAVSASHTDDQITQLLGLLKQWKDKHESN